MARSTRSLDHVAPSSSLYEVVRLNRPAPQCGDVMFVQYSLAPPFGRGPHAIAACNPMPRRERAPGLDAVGCHVRPPSREIRMSGVVEQAAPGPRCTYTTASRFGSVGCVATTGSQARSAIDRGIGLTRRSSRTRGTRATASEGAGLADGVGSFEVGDDSAGVVTGDGIAADDDDGAGRGVPLGRSATATGAHAVTARTTGMSRPSHVRAFTPRGPSGARRPDRVPASRRTSPSDGGDPDRRSAGR